MIQVLRQRRLLLSVFVRQASNRRREVRTYPEEEEIKYRLAKFIFMPEQNVYMVRPYRPVADNVVVFHVDMKFSKFEIKNYLEQIYGLKVARVNTMIALGQTKEIIPIESETRKHKFPDKKIAFVLLAEGKFTYPDVSAAMFSEEEISREFGTGQKDDLVEDEEDEDDGKKKKKKKKPKYEPIERTIS